MRLFLPFRSFVSLLIFSFCSCVLNGLFAQDLHVYYDAYTDSTHYKINGRSVSKPHVKKGQQVVVHVENYNNYLYNLELQWQNRRAGYAEASGLSYAGQADGGGVNPLSLLLGGGSPLDVLSMMGGGGEPPRLSSGFGFAEEAVSRPAIPVAAQQQLASFSKAVRAAESIAYELEAIELNAKNLLEAQQIQTFAAAELQRLCTNKQLPPTQIKALSGEYISRIFNEQDPKKINLGSVLQKSKPLEEYYTLKTSYAGGVADYAKEVSQMEASLNTLRILADMTEGGILTPVVEEASTTFQSASENVATYTGNLKALDQQAGAMQGLGTRELADLRLQYLSIMENDFHKTFRHTVTEDELDFSLLFTPVDSFQTAGLTSKTVQPVALNVYGGLQINASIGLSFGQFFQQPQNYFVRDSVIRQSDKDTFTPYITSFVHFYPQSRRGASLGGSFGVGLPIGSGTSFDAITFFLGPSLIIGRQQRITLSGGLLGGKVAQLDGGYEVGDTFDLNSDFLPTSNTYRLGYALGISFNLASGR